jgi:hypothetical protein
MIQGIPIIWAAELPDDDDYWIVPSRDFNRKGYYPAPKEEKW